MHFFFTLLRMSLTGHRKNFNEVELRININSEINMTSSDT